MNWNKIPSLAALRAFEAAARNQNFSHAATELNVTHAAIAQHVRKLEDYFSEALIERQGRGVIATDAGRALAESLRAGFSIIEDGVEALRLRQEDRPLYISVTPAFAVNWLMPRIGEFWQMHPEISLSINPSTDLVDLKSDKFDLAVRHGDGDWPQVSAEILTDGDFWVVVHPDLVVGRQISGLQDLTDFPWLMEASMVERQIVIESEGIDFEDVDLTILLTNDLVISAAVAGLGVTVQPRSIVEREIKIGALVKICELNQTGLAYYMVTLPDRVSPNLRIFMNWLRSKAKDQ